MATDSDATHDKLRQLAASLSSSVEQYDRSDKESRTSIVRAAQQVISTVGRIPEEQMLDDSIKAGEMVSKHLFSLWGVFDAIPAEGSVSLADLAATVSCDVKLLGMPDHREKY